MWWRVTTLLSLLFVVFYAPCKAADDLEDADAMMDESMDDMDLDDSLVDDDDPAEIMAELDKDGDGFLTLEELLLVEEDGDAAMQANLKKHFAKADADGDKKLNVPELGQLVKNFELDDEDEL
mmetsp:Transcript_23438/g.43166  ORF Transcript_23438/g.43166 Transcript_23438/m.43166 type:complete len:123 (-) Transcript_23438:78-446(-)